MIYLYSNIVILLFITLQHFLAAAGHDEASFKYFVQLDAFM